MNKKTMLSVALVLLLLMAGMWWLWREPAAQPALPNPGASAAPTASRQAPALNPSPADTAPPWANANSAAPIAPPGVPGSAIERQRALEKMQLVIANVARDGNHADPRKVIDMLTQMKALYGPALSGVNLDAMLNNVEKAQAMQTLAENMQLEAKKPGGPDRATLLAEMAQLKTLQGQLRTDISVPRTPRQP